MIPGETPVFNRGGKSTGERTRNSEEERHVLASRGRETMELSPIFILTTSLLWKSFKRNLQHQPCKNYTNVSIWCTGRRVDFPEKSLRKTNSLIDHTSLTRSSMDGKDIYVCDITVSVTSTQSHIKGSSCFSLYDQYNEMLPNSQFFLGAEHNTKRRQGLPTKVIGPTHKMAQLNQIGLNHLAQKPIFNIEKMPSHMWHCMLWESK